MRISKGFTSVRKLAECVGIHPQALYRLAKEGKFGLATGSNGAMVVAQSKLRQLLGLPDAETLPKGLTTIKAAAAARELTPAALYFAISKGNLVPTKVNGTVYVTDAALKNWDEQRKLAREMRELNLKLATLQKMKKRLTQITVTEEPEQPATETVLH